MTINVDQASTTNPADGVTPDAPVAKPDGKTPDGNPAQPETVESLPDWAQRLVKDLRKENEKRRQAIDNERQQAEEKRLADEKKWQELAEQRAKERDEYKPYRERYEALATQQRAALMAETAKWPAEVKALLPGDDADVQVLADAVAKARALVAALNGKTVEQAQGAHGLPPRAVGQDGKERETARREMAATVRNW